MTERPNSKHPEGSPNPEPPTESPKTVPLGERLARIHAILDDTTSSPWAHDAIELVMATVISTRLAEQPGHARVWLLIEGNPSGGKTSTILKLGNEGAITYVDTLTANALSSGYKPEKKNDKKPDLLQQLEKSKATALVIKDLTTLLSGRDDTVSGVLGDLNSIYDGTFTKWTGTVGGLTYKCRFSIVAAVTPAAMRKHHRQMSKIGTRFISYRIPSLTLDQQEAGLAVGWISDLTEHEAKLAKCRRMVEALVNTFIEHPLPVITVAEPYQREINRLARLVAKARGVVQWRRESGEPEEIDMVQIEEPFRAQGQLRTLAEALAIVHGRQEVTSHEIELVRRVALSSMPADRAQIVALFPAHPDGLTVAAASESTGLGDHRLRQLFRELERLGVIVSGTGHSSGGRAPVLYHPVPEFAEILSRPIEPLDHRADLGDFSSHTHNEIRVKKKRKHQPRRGVCGEKWGLLDLVSLPWPTKRRRAVTSAMVAGDGVVA